MARNNENAGMHFVGRNYNFEYNEILKEAKKEREREERLSQYKELGHELMMETQKRKKKEYNSRINYIRWMGEGAVNTVMTNLAYYSYLNEISLSKCATDVNRFITEHAKDEWNWEGGKTLQPNPGNELGCYTLNQVLFYLGLMSERLEVDFDEIFVPRQQEIGEFFINEIKEILEDSSSRCEQRDSKALFGRHVYCEKGKKVLNIVGPIMSVHYGIVIYPGHDNEEDQISAEKYKAPSIISLNDGIVVYMESLLDEEDDEEEDSHPLFEILCTHERLQGYFHG